MFFYKKIYFLIIFVFLNGCFLFLEKHYTFKKNFLSSVINVDNRFALRKLWSNFITDACKDNYLFLHPTCNGSKIFIANYSGDVKALDKDTGKTLWLTKISSNIASCLSGGLIVNDNLLYVGSELSKLYALNVDDGCLVWQRDIFGELLSDPVIYDDVLFVHTNNGRLLALNKKDGSINWIFNFDNMPLFMIRGSSSPVVALGMVIIGEHDGSISAISVVDGKLIWRQDFFALRKETAEVLAICKDIVISPVLIDNMIYTLTCDGKFVGLSLVSGDIIWSLDIVSYKNILVKGNFVYLIDKNSCLFAIDLKDRVVLWTKKICISSIMISSVVLLYDCLCLGDKKGFFYCFSIHDGMLIAKNKINVSGLLNIYYLFGDRLVMQTTDGVVCMFKIILFDNTFD